MKSLFIAILVVAAFVFGTQVNADMALPNQTSVDQKDNNVYNLIRQITGAKPTKGMKGEYVMADAHVSCIKDANCIITFDTKAKPGSKNKR